MKLDVQALMAWGALIQQAVSLGVTSWHLIEALLKDAGADDAAIAQLKPKWDALHDDVRRAAGL